MPHAGLASRRVEEPRDAEGFRPRIVPAPDHASRETEDRRRRSSSRRVSGPVSRRASAEELGFDPDEILRAWEDSVMRETARESAPESTTTLRPIAPVRPAPARQPASARALAPVRAIAPAPAAVPEFDDVLDDFLAEDPIESVPAVPLAPPARRTVTITGTGVVDRLQPPAVRRRAAQRAYERPSFRPDRTAMWAVFLCVLMILAAALSAHAG